MSNEKIIQALSELLSNHLSTLEAEKAVKAKALRNHRSTLEAEKAVKAKALHALLREVLAAFQKELIPEASMQALQNQAENVRRNALKAFREKRAVIDNPIKLEDFEWLKTNEENALGPSFTLAWRFDQQRLVNLNISLTDGSALLRQTYKDCPKLPDNMMLQPIQFGPHAFKTQVDKFWRCSLTPEWVSQIAKAFHLPEPYQEWEKTVTILPELLKLAKLINKSEYTHTNDELRKLYKLLSIAAWIKFLQEAGRPQQSTVMLGYRSQATTTDSLTESESEWLNPLVMQTTIEEKQLCLTFIWEGRPEIIEHVKIEVDDEPQHEVSFEWESDRSCLKLSHFGMSEEDWVGALWDREIGTLRLSFKTKSKTSE